MGSCILQNLKSSSVFIVLFFLFQTRTDIFTILKGLELLYQNNSFVCIHIWKSMLLFWSVFAGASCVVTACKCSMELVIRSVQFLVFGTSGECNQYQENVLRTSNWKIFKFLFSRCGFSMQPLKENFLSTQL